MVANRTPQQARAALALREGCAVFGIAIGLSLRAVSAQSIGPDGKLEQGPPTQPLPHPDLPPPLTVGAPLPWWLLALGGLILLVLVGFVVWLLFRPRAAAKAPVPQPLPIALRKMRELRTMAESLEPPDVGHRVSEILRQYYMGQYAIPAPFRTTPELFAEEDSEGPAFLQGRRQLWRQRFAPIAGQYDEMAFAPKPSTRENALRLVETALSKLEEERP